MAKSLIYLNEWIRSQTISIPTDAQLEISPSERREYSRAFDHSGTLTRLYSTYERFVFDLIGIWLKALTATRYKHLNQKELNELFESYKSHCGFCLQHFSEQRLESLGTQKLLLSATKAVRRRTTSLLFPEPFFSNTNNLRLADLKNLLSNVKIKDIEKYINSQSSVKEFLDGIGTSLDAYLRNFIQRRNEAAHGTAANDLLGSQSLIELADFLHALGESIFELIVRNLLLSQYCVPVGEITEYYKSKNTIVIRSNTEHIAVGNKIVVSSETRTIASSIENIMIEGNTQTSATPGNLDFVGLKVSNPLRKTGVVYRILDPIQEFI